MNPQEPSRSIPMTVAPTSAEAEKNRGERLSVSLKAAYGTGALVDGMASTALNMFLFFYMTAVCGLSGTLAGLSLVMALVIDSFADPLIGSFSDHTHSRW